MRNIIKRRITLAMAALAVSGIVACASLGALGGFKEPVVSFKDLRVRGLGLTGGSLDAYLNVYNPNGFKLDATRLSYAVSVGDNAQLGSGVLDSRFTVQDKDSTTVRIPVSFSWSGLGAGMRSIFSTGAVNYRVVGDVTVGTPVGNFTIPYSQTGRYSTLGR